jgi:HK97 gp10 family phage protein
MAETITVTGLREVQRSLYSYSQQLGDRVVRGSLRLGAKVIQKAAQQKAPFKTGKLRRGIVVRSSKFHRGRSSKDMIGLYIGVYIPFYGRFQEDGWNTKGKRNELRANFRFKGRMTRRSITSSRVTQPGKTDVLGSRFFYRAFNEKREEAVDVVVRAATAASDVLARNVGL